MPDSSYSKSGGTIVVTANETEPMGGSGTAADPYTIANLAQPLYFRCEYNGSAWGERVPGGVVDGVTQPDSFDEKKSIVVKSGEAFWYISRNGDPVIELLNESRGFMAKSESIGYADLLAGGYLDVNQTGMGAPVNATDAYVFRGYTAIPEPTSGVLLLVVFADGNVKVF